MVTHILLCTVGGSHQPIVTAIEALKDRASQSEGRYFVCFFCTETIGKRPGSITQVTGPGNVIKEKPSDPRCTLPNIPTQTGLAASCFGTCIVHPDNLDEAYLAMRRQIRELRTQHAGAQFVADYTGATKAMTAALVCAATESEYIDLEVVIGQRVDLVSVSPGTHAAAAVQVTGMQTDRDVVRHLRLWKQFAYDQAAQTLSRVHMIAGTPAQERALLAKNLSESLALWDSFDHGGAFIVLGRCKGDIMGNCSDAERSSLIDMFGTIESLAERGSERSEVLQLFDLWLNAERRGAQGRFDDAVARWYRLMEWTAQWLLKTVLEIGSTAKFPRSELPEGVEIPGTEKTVELGLLKAWQVVEGRFDPDAAGIEGVARRFIDDSHKKLLDLIRIRNNSRLAHGFDPVTRKNWEDVKSFTEQHVLCILREALKIVKLKRVPAQLPQSPPNFLLWPYDPTRGSS